MATKNASDFWGTNRRGKSVFMPASKVRRQRKKVEWSRSQSIWNEHQASKARWAGRRAKAKSWFS